MTTAAKWWRDLSVWAKAGWICETFVLDLIWDVETLVRNFLSRWERGA